MRGKDRLPWGKASVRGVGGRGEGACPAGWMPGWCTANSVAGRTLNEQNKENKSAKLYSGTQVEKQTSRQPVTQNNRIHDDRMWSNL